MRTTPFLLLAVLLALVVGIQCDADDIELLGRGHGHAHHHHHGEKVTRLRFYLHDTLSGKDPGAVLVGHDASRNPKRGDPTPFGSVFAADDALTEGPEKQSKVIGNAQGLYLSSGKRELALVLGMDFEFTDGPFKGSAFVVFSRNEITHPVGREVAIVGGRGRFRMARGFALIRTIHLDTNTGDAVLEYNVTLVHY